MSTNGNLMTQGVSDLFDRNYECQSCGNEFSSKQVKTSAIRTKERERDFHAYFSGESPMYYGVICCPNCGYAQFESDFKSKLSTTDRVMIQEHISSKWRPQNFSDKRDTMTAVKVHLIALANYRILKAKVATVAKLYLRLAWFYRELANEEEEQKYLKLALQAFVQSIETERYEDEDGKELETIYLVGELNRRLGEYKEAIKWFNKAVNHEYAYKNRMIKTYARDQWALCTEAYKEEKSKELQG